MGVSEEINNIMGGIENTGTVKQHNHKKKLRQRFDIIKKLGQGTFGKVQLGINKETGQEVAIKTIKKSKIESEADLIRIRREIQIMSSVQHPNIIHIYEVFENREKMVLVMEYAAGGELYDYLSERKVLDEEEARRIFRQIATACYYCHKHKICHRDLKLENILLDENNNAKIADFGLSNVFDDQRLLNTFCGSPLYASPEIVKGTPYHGPEADCWSLGVLLYTLVYGAMPFDGSNFRRLVKQISQGDYFEPTKPSPASPLIREMLTVNPQNRANIEKICNHWWVNEGYSVSCLEISEELANQTPVRLDVLLSLAPPPPQLESEKLMVTGEEDNGNKSDSIAPTRSQSVGSLMEMSGHHPNRSIIDMLKDDKATPKRKLENTVSTDRANLDKRKDKIIKENTVADITVHGAIVEHEDFMEDASMTEPAPLNKSLTQTITKDMDMEEAAVEATPPQVQGAVSDVSAEVEAEKDEKKKQPLKLKKTLSTSVSSKVLEGINEIPSQENVTETLDKENIKEKVEAEKKVEEKKMEAKTPVKKKVIKKKVLSDKNDNNNAKEVASTSVSEAVEAKKSKDATKEAVAPAAAVTEGPSKPVERRKSRIFEAAEKFQSMMSPTTETTKPGASLEKPKKVIIPGVSVDGFKKEFERKASITSPTSPTKAVIKTSKKEEPVEAAAEEQQQQQQPASKQQEAAASAPPKTDDDRQERVRNAVSIISSALDKEGARKSKSRPCVVRKPPVPFGVGGRSASGNIGMISSPPSGPKPFVRPCFDRKEQQVEQHTPATPPAVVEQQPEETTKTSTAEITLKSATLPRRKISAAATAAMKTEQPPPPAAAGFKTEVVHNVEAFPSNKRTEIVVPIAGKQVRSTPIDTAPKATAASRERIIPIAFEKQDSLDNPPVQSSASAPPKPPLARQQYQTQNSNGSQRTNLSRQSTQDSDSETIGSSGEPIKKSAREYIIPIAVEGGGYVTPRAGSLEPSDSGTTTTASSMAKTKTKFGRARRLNSLFNDRDSEDESSPFSTTLHRHGSIGRDSDTEDPKRDAFHILRSTRPTRANLEHNDSLSSGEEDDDEGFEILTAENLFSTLLSRVRDLTQRLNVDDGMRPGFPTSSRLLSHFDHGTNFWNRMEHPLSRHSSLGRTLNRPTISKTTTGSSFGVPWRRSVTRDLSSDIDGGASSTPFNKTTNNQRPLGDDDDDDLSNENLNLADLDLNKLKLSEEDALALSYLTPGLSRRIQKQLLAQLAPSEVRKLQRTLSSRTSEEHQKEPKKMITRQLSERITSSTLPRRLSSEINRFNGDNMLESVNETNIRTPRSFLPVVKRDEVLTRPSYEFNVRSSSIGAEPKGDSKFLYRNKPKITKSLSVREPRSYSITRNDLQSPDSSISESSSKCISDSSASRPYSKYSDSSSFSRYSPSRYDSNQLLAASDAKTSESKKPTTTGKRVSRFLRPDFFDAPKEESIYLKEKKEREMETQKVLKEIRDKRKSRLRRERSQSREKQLETDESERDFYKKKEEIVKEADKLLTNVCNSIKTLENNMKVLQQHDYINVPGPSQAEANDTTPTPNTAEKSAKLLHDYVNVKAADVAPAVKKEKVSKIARPKSYPSEETAKKISPDKESKLTKLRKGFSRQGREKSKEDKNFENKTINQDDKGQKNKLLQSIEKKLEKFRSTGNMVKDPKEVKAMQEKKSSVESAIKRLREQSLPRNLEHCTESGLIKRAVSVEDMSSGSAPLQASRKSVTKILGLFKKYEEQDKKKVLKKPSKSKESGTKSSNSSKKESDNNDKQNESVMNVEAKTTKTDVVINDDAEQNEKKERPRSLLFDKVRQFQSTPTYNGAKSDSVLVDTKESKANNNNNKSKLPLNSYRRSLNLDNLPEPPKFYKNPVVNKTNNNNAEEKTERKNLKLDLTKSTKPSTSATNTNTGETSNRNSTATDDSCSTILSPSDDYLSCCDSWSVCSDFHHVNDLLSPNNGAGGGHGNHHHLVATAYSGDENESVIDRIRRKSFYTRFNEKKRTRRPTISYKDLDFGYNNNNNNSNKSPSSSSSSHDYHHRSLDRRTDQRNNNNNPVTRRASYASSLLLPESTSGGSGTNNGYGNPSRHYIRSASVMNDYVNVPNRYQMYNSSCSSSKIGRPNSSSSTSLLYSDHEDNNSLDDLLSTAKSRKFSTQLTPSRNNRTSISPSNDYLADRFSSTPNNSEPI